MNCKNNIVDLSSHPLINWILGVFFASVISIGVVMIVEVYFIDSHISNWKDVELRHEIAKYKCQDPYNSKNSSNTKTGNDILLDGIDKIESFYDRRFVTLLWTMGVLVVLTGVVLPILFAIIQYQSAKTERADIENSIDEFKKLRNDFDTEAKQSREKINSIYDEFYTRSAQNYHGFAESWFRQYQESGGVSAVGAAIVYCGIAIENNLNAHNAKGARSNILMLARIDSLLSDSTHSNDKGIVVAHLKRFRWPVASSAIRSCMESDNNFAEKYIDLSIETYERIMETYGIPNLRENE